MRITDNMKEVTMTAEEKMKRALRTIALVAGALTGAVMYFIGHLFGAW